MLTVGEVGLLFVGLKSAKMDGIFGPVEFFVPLRPCALAPLQPLQYSIPEAYIPMFFSDQGSNSLAR